VIRAVRDAERVEGRSGFAAVTGAWFPCRVVLGEAVEIDDRGHRRILARAQLVARTADLRSSDRVEIDGLTWSVASQPETLRTHAALPVVTAVLERVVAAPAPPSAVA